MAGYIDGFVLPIPENGLDDYRRVASQIAAIWKEHGAVEYREFVGDDILLDGTKSFCDAVNTDEHEVVIFGWVTFDSKESRDSANALVAADPRMSELIGPIVDPDNLIFDASRMAYGGFRPLVGS